MLDIKAEKLTHIQSEGDLPLCVPRELVRNYLLARLRLSRADNRSDCAK
jgi:hypothetical protein